MSLPRYAEYKDSGVGWLGAVPAHWGVSPLKYLASFENGCVFKPGSWSDSGTPIIRIENLNGSLNFNFYDGPVDERHHVSSGDLLFGWSGNRGTSFGPFIWGRNGSHYLNQHIFKVQSRGCDRRWLYWCLRAVTAHVEDQATGIIGMVHVTKGDLGSIRVPLPSLEEQKSQATFLDRETAKIDALTAEQETLLVLLAEKRQATISHAVTRGLDCNTPMKDSGIPWLGQVPAHWEVAELRRFVDGFEQGWSPECESRTVEEGEWGVLKAGCVNGGAFAASEHKALPASLEPRPELEVRSGDVLMSRASGSPKLIGSVAFVEKPPAQLMLSDKIFRLRLSSGVVSRFFALLMGSDPLRQQIEQAIGGAEGLANNLPQSSIKEFWIAMPPESEQKMIMAEVNKELTLIHQLRLAAEQAVQLLKERRSALIAAAVTGKIDVRGSA